MFHSKMLKFNRTLFLRFVLFQNDTSFKCTSTKFHVPRCLYNHFQYIYVIINEFQRWVSWIREFIIHEFQFHICAPFAYFLATYSSFMLSWIYVILDCREQARNGMCSWIKLCEWNGCHYLNSKVVATISLGRNVCFRYILYFYQAITV